MNDRTELARHAPYIQAIAGAEDKFIRFSKSHNLVEYQREANFARMAIEKNDYLMKIADKHPQSLRDAVINIAAVGLTLNPAQQYAYIVPRDGAACLDISYKGLIKLATDSGAIKWVQAEVVYSSDEFEYNGPTEKPTHKSQPFAKDRGDIIGVYCVAKLADGDFLTEVMAEADIKDVMLSSPAAAKDHSPWKRFYGEMCKKTVIKRASKTWPRTEQGERLAEAIEILNEHEGIDDESRNGSYQGLCEQYLDYSDQISKYSPQAQFKHAATVSIKDQA